MVKPKEDVTFFAVSHPGAKTSTFSQGFKYDYQQSLGRILRKGLHEDLREEKKVDHHNSDPDQDDERKAIYEFRTHQVNSHLNAQTHQSSEAGLIAQLARANHDIEDMAAHIRSLQDALAEGETNFLQLQNQVSQVSLAPTTILPQPVTSHLREVLDLRSEVERLTSTLRVA